MRLIECHIDNFGTFHDFDMKFENGLNVIMQENGWGKSTLAAFFKAMLYGYDSKRSRDITENERLRYKPWRGGTYGGTLVFEKDGKHFKVSRTFGNTAAFDIVRLSDLDEGRTIDADNIGEWLFGLDAGAFKRSAYITHNELGSEISGLSFHSRLNSVLGEASDVGAFNHAVDTLTKRVKDYDKRGRNGYITQLSDRIDELLSSQRTAKMNISRVEDTRQRLTEIDRQLKNTENRISEITEQLSEADMQKQKREAELEVYKKMLENKALFEKEYEDIALTEGNIPTEEEICSAKLLQPEIKRLSEALKNEKAKNDSERKIKQEQLEKLLEEKKQLEERREKIFAGGIIPDSEDITSVPEICEKIKLLADELQTEASKRSAENTGIKKRHLELLENLKALEEKLAEKKSGYIPSADELRELRRVIGDLHYEEGTLSELSEKVKKIRGEISLAEERYGGEIPSAADISSALQISSSLAEYGNDENISNLLNTEQEKLDNLKAFFGDEIPEEEKISQMRSDCAEAGKKQIEAEALEAKAAGEKAKAESIESAMNQLEMQSDIRDIHGEMPKPAVGVALIAAAVVAVVLGSVISPVLFTVAALLLISGIAVLVRNNKKKAEINEKIKSFEEEKRRKEEKKKSLEAELAVSLNAFEENKNSADKKRREAEEIFSAALSYVQNWVGGADINSIEANIKELLERLSELAKSENAYAMYENQLAEKRKNLAAFESKISSVADRLPADTEALGFEKRAALALEDIENLSRLKTALETENIRIEDTNGKIKKHRAYIKELSDKTGIPENELEKSIPDIERKIADIDNLSGEIKSARERISAFEELNGAALAGSNSQDSYEEKLTAELDDAKSALKNLCDKYGISEDNVSEWSRNAAKGLAEYEDILQKEEILSVRIVDFKNANAAILAPDTDNSDRLKLEWELEQAKNKLLLILSKYNSSIENISEWVAHSEEIISRLNGITSRINAENIRIKEFEENNPGIENITEESDEIKTARLRLTELTRRRDELKRERTQSEDFISHADESLKTYRTTLSEIDVLGEEKQNAQKSLFVLNKSIEYIKKAKENLASRYMGQIEDNFNSYLSAWINSEKIKGVIDSDFNVSMDEDGSTHDTKSYSAGYSDVIDFCMRMALIDTLFEDEKPFIIMDDPFVNLDSGRIAHAMKLLKMISASSQVIYFVCHDSRANEPDSEFEGEIVHKKIIRSAAPEIAQTVRRDRFIFTEAPALVPVSDKRKITNNIFSMEFKPEKSEMSHGEFELFFVDEKDRLICDRQLIGIENGETVPSKIRFCLNTGNASGNAYRLMIRNTASAENEIAKVIEFESAITFASDFDI